MNITGVIFDLDGLLIDSETIALQTYQQVCDLNQIDPSTALFHQLLGRNSKDGKQILEQNLPKHINSNTFHQQWRNAYIRRIQQPINLKPGAKAILEWLHQSSIAFAIASSSSSEHGPIKLKNAGIDTYFKHCVFGDQVENGKPSPDIFIQAANLINQPVEQCLVLEDSDHGVLAGTRAGMQVIQIPDIKSPSEETLALKHQILNSLDEVLNWLQTIKK